MTLKRKLKGKNSKKLKPEQKAKMQKTLAKMDKTRQDDTIRLRTKIEAHIVEYTSRLQKIEAFLKDAQTKKMRIEGAIISLKELLNTDSEK